MHRKAEDLIGQSIGDGKWTETRREVGVGRLPMRWDRVMQISRDPAFGERGSVLIATAGTDHKEMPST